MQLFKCIVKKMASYLSDDKCDDVHLSSLGTFSSSRKIKFEGKIKQKKIAAANEIENALISYGYFGQTNRCLTREILDLTFNDSNNYKNKQAVEDCYQHLIKKYER